MPLFEYECRQCNHRFEALQRHDETPDGCPRCQGVQLERQLSVFAVNASGQQREAAPPPPSCGGCREQGGCPMAQA